jgi:hypothetical protein
MTGLVEEGASITESAPSTEASISQPRRFRLNWGSVRYVAGQFVVIVVGVLVALAVDQWRSDRNDRAREAEYLARLTADLTADTATFSEFLSLLGTKSDVLGALLVDSARSLSNAEPSALMDRLTASGFVALPPNRAGTFRELQTTGNLGLLEDVSMRDALAQYYMGYDHISGVLAASPGSYRLYLWSAIPGDLSYRRRVGDGAVDGTQLANGLATLRRMPDLTRVVNAELTYTAAMTYYLTEYRRIAQNLLTLLSSQPD